MPVAALNTSTLSEAITSETNEFTVASTANISVGNLLVIRDEAVKVQAIPVSGRVKVMRGVNGTFARAHASGQRFFIGAPDAFKASRESLLARVGASGVYPDYLLPGQRATDGAGNEYVLLELASTTYGGTSVLISRDGLYTAIPLADGQAGSVAVTVEANSSAQYAWGQIYGRARAQLVGGSSLATSAGLVWAATSVSTPAVGLAAGLASQASSNESVHIHGMYITSAASSDTTSATSATGLHAYVWLNYPFVRGLATS